MWFGRYFALWGSRTGFPLVDLWFKSANNACGAAHESVAHLAIGESNSKPVMLQCLGSDKSACHTFECFLTCPCLVWRSCVCVDNARGGRRLRYISGRALRFCPSDRRLERHHWLLDSRRGACSVFDYIITDLAMVLLYLYHVILHAIHGKQFCCNELREVRNTKIPLGVPAYVSEEQMQLYILCAYVTKKRCFNCIFFILISAQVVFRCRLYFPSK